MEKQTELKSCTFCGGDPTKVPCKGCQSREPGCHGKCDQYREWRKKLTAVRQKERLEKPESMEWQLYHKGK